MSIGIIVAMNEELEVILREMQKEKTEVRANMEFHVGDLLGKKIVAVVCGIGKVNSAICTQVLISEYGVSKIVNIGIAGGIGKDIVPGDIVIGDSLVQHDMDATAFGDKVGQIPRLDTFDFKSDKLLVDLAKGVCESITEHKSYIGRIATGDQFVADVEKIKWLSEEFNALACEMEGGSIAHTCYLNNIPFIVIRSISDNANTGAHMDFEKFKYIAVENSSNILKNMISNM
ncbi:bifunctional 5'-methylthioadenosine/S-adenosylhomocysteine nucleosidase MtnN [Gottschalkia acidurici 9a]|uniref:adenosylhomocysteine nucleosidase n=1 Tax=Gottschalkia acidurici (strain ATCC 7906 / DSM 604 / BCRC 14475 / CIP 104303 / KCTC 5404 / NCIMB 10678 / 9a) TaxID=1128398 RepID=K0B1H9_GOTA9|nr:5'-methylthioadenosine/adenosylhomocysteine nucleosidase [Gottschalkia acidurici]AFS78541.1 bifunctional 5'-methylthioadenosine/S-adenosylhomocysteine nucleosidase MtnN [Gottschalkia acidurici 9a]